MFPIYICWDRYVTEAEKRAIERAVYEIEPIFGCDFICYGNKSWNEGRYKSADEIIASAPHNENGQADGTNVLNKLEETMRKWTEPGAFVLFTGQDLKMVNTNWCFGVARMSSRVTVQSTIRYRSLPEKIASDCIKRTLRHELGHIFGCAADPKRTNTEQKLGSHCTNYGCSMRQTMSLQELVDDLPTENATRCFCSQCMADLRRFKQITEQKEPALKEARGRVFKREPYGRRAI